MDLHTLTTISHKSKRRLGQGHGSGRMKTAGRGTKGQKARYDIPLAFEGGALPLIKRMPFLRGKDRNKSFLLDPVILNVSQLNKLPNNSEVTFETLVAHNLVSKKEAMNAGIKILGDGELKMSLVVKLPVSKQAEEKIVKAGGRIELESTTVTVTA